MMKHRVFLAAVLLTALAFSQSAKAYDFSAVAPSGQTLYYNIVDSTVQVTCQNSSSPYYSTYPTGALTIPATVTYNDTTYLVTKIGNHAFDYCSGLTSITIPNTVASIGENAFGECSGLTSVTIPNSVTRISNYAFSGCNGLTSITIPNSVTAIGDYTFWGCTGLTTVTIPGSVTSIGDFAFFNCDSMTDLYCYIADPSAISMGEDVFPRKTTVSSGCTLHVPNGTADAFQADKQWYPYFGHIVEDPHPNQ